MKFLILLASIAFADEGYNGLKWWSNESSLTKEISEGKKNKHCEKLYMVRDQLTLPDNLGKVIQNSTLFRKYYFYLPKYGDSAPSGPDEYSRSYKLKSIKDVCGLFFDKQLVAVINKPELTNDETLAALNTKYTKAISEQDRVQTFETPDSFIFFYPDRYIKTKHDAPVIVYASKNQGKIREKLTKLTQGENQKKIKENEQSKKKALNSI